MFWAKKIGPQGLPNPGPNLSFQPTANKFDFLKNFCTLASNLCIKNCFGPKKLDPKDYKTLDLFGCY